MRGEILTLGGGGFSMSADGTSLIDDYLLARTRNDQPGVCFVPTASGDDRDYIERFFDAFAGRARTSVLTLFGSDAWPYAEPASVLDADVVYVGGGSTANLLALWRLHGLPGLLEQAAARGTVLAGISAGMNCWFQGSSTDSFGPLRALQDGLGFLRGSACPHYLSDTDRRPAFHRMIETGELPGGVAADDGAALLWRDGVLIEAVTERPNGQAFHVELGGAGVLEKPMPVRFLG
jgi:dipeptidase E